MDVSPYRMIGAASSKPRLEATGPKSTSPDTRILKCSKFKNIAEAKPKYYHLTIQGPASALRYEVLGYYSWGGLPCLLPNLGLAIGPNLAATAVTKP
jgi:hypothetical protein